MVFNEKKSGNAFTKDCIEIHSVCKITKLAKASRKSCKKGSVLLIAVMVRKGKYVLGFHVANTACKS